MARNSLPYAVEFNDGLRPFFERIAAFDCEQAARHYAKDCAEIHQTRTTYRVVYRTKIVLLELGHQP